MELRQSGEDTVIHQTRQWHPFTGFLLSYAFVIDKRMEQLESRQPLDRYTDKKDMRTESPAWTLLDSSGMEAWPV